MWIEWVGEIEVKDFWVEVKVIDWKKVLLSRFFGILWVICRFCWILYVKVGGCVLLDLVMLDGVLIEKEGSERIGFMRFCKKLL